MVFSNLNFCFFICLASLSGDKRNDGLRIILPSHFPLIFKNVRVFKSTGSLSFTHTFHLSKFILDVAFMSKKGDKKKEKKS